VRGGGGDALNSTLEVLAQCLGAQLQFGGDLGAADAILSGLYGACTAL
jgi:hypothetical protein